MIGLVERDLEIDRFVVQGNVGEFGARQLLDADLAHAEIGADVVLGSARAQHGIHLVKERIVQRPQARFRDGHLKLRLLRAARDGLRGVRQVAGLEMQRQLRARRCRVVQLRLHRHLAGVDVRRIMDRRDAQRRPGLEIDRLPDALGGPVSLLALELEVVRGVIHPQDELLILTPLDVGCQFELERRVAALVRAQRLAVDPALRQPVACADHHEHALAFPRLGHFHGALIPADIRLVLEAGELRAPRKRNGDLVGKLRLATGPPRALADVVLVEAELPDAIEVLPVGAFKIRPGMFRQRDGRGRQRLGAEHVQRGERRHAGGKGAG